MNVMKQRVIGATLAGLMSIGMHAQLVVSTDLTPAQLVQDVLLGSGITVSNVTFNGIADPTTAQPGTGSFVTSGSNLGVPAGIILSTGFAEGIASGQDGFQSDQLVPDISDPDLAGIAGINLHNAAILEFDFIPNGDSVKFRYVFGSEEYPEFVCAYNDAFGFFLSGPGISGPYALGAENIAIVPNSTTPVTIDNVNNGYNNNGDPDDPDCPPVNPTYYIDNTGGTTVVYDGFTVVLEAKRFVQCGQQYHIKLAIADAIDQAYDSGVFLEAGSFSSSPFVPSLTPGPGIVGNNISESCFPMSLSYLRLGESTEADTFQVVYGGTFTNGVDIVPALPDEVIFPAGVSSIPFTFNAPIDTDVLETIVITVESISECTGDTIENVFNFFVQEAPPLALDPEPFYVDCGASVEIGIGVSGGYGAYVYDWGDGNTDPTLIVGPLVDTTYPVTVSDACDLVASSTVDVQVLPSQNPFYVELVPGPTVQFNSVQESCYEVAMLFTRFGSTLFEDTAYVVLAGDATDGEDYSGVPVQVIFPLGVSEVSIPVVFPQDADGFESLEVSLGDLSPCNGTISYVSNTFSITQGPALFALGASPLIPCGGSTTLTPTVTGGYAPYAYAWEGGSSDPTIVVGPNEATIYTLTVSDDCGNSTEATFTVDLVPPPPINMAIIGPATVTEACQNTSINIIRPNGVQGELVLTMSYSGGATNGTDYNWPSTQTIGADLLNVILPFQPLEDGVADNDEDAVITASYTDACGRTVNASVTITILDAPAITLVTEDATVECGPDSLAVIAIANGGFGGLDLVWNTGDVGSMIYVPIISSGTYVVTATDACGRTAVAQSTVTVDCDIDIPNVFTPNGDGKNDRFDIDGILSTDNTVKVFNRWGQVVFEAKNYRNTWNANGVPDGTYYYEVIVPREPKPLTGHVTILRNDW